MVCPKLIAEADDLCEVFFEWFVNVCKRGGEMKGVREKKEMRSFSNYKTMSIKSTRKSKRCFAKSK